MFLFPAETSIRRATISGAIPVSFNAPEACNAVCATVCDDENECTVDDTDDCEQSGCPPFPRAPTDCNDSLGCTDDTCDPASGCGNAAVVCNAPDLCTISACAEPEGFCLDTAVVCDEGEECNPLNGFCEASFLYGDTDQDGDFDGLDMSLLLSWLLGNPGTPLAGEPAFIAADVTGDLVLNFEDFMLFQNHLDGSIKKFPVEDC